MISKIVLLLLFLESPVSLQKCPQGVQLKILNRASLSIQYQRPSKKMKQSPRINLGLFSGGCCKDQHMGRGGGETALPGVLTALLIQLTLKGMTAFAT